MELDRTFLSTKFQYFKSDIMCYPQQKWTKGHEDLVSELSRECKKEKEPLGIKRQIHPLSLAHMTA